MIRNRAVLGGGAIGSLVGVDVTQANYLCYLSTSAQPIQSIEI